MVLLVRPAVADANYLEAEGNAKLLLVTPRGHRCPEIKIRGLAFARGGRDLEFGTRKALVGRFVKDGLSGATL